MTVNEQEFREKLTKKLLPYKGQFKSVSGPGRSGAVAAVYASHLLGIPFLPYGANVPNELYPLLMVDTAVMSGKTLKKACKKMMAQLGIAIMEEPPRVKFWYELTSTSDLGSM